MGNVSVSFTQESGDFSKQRLQRMEAEASSATKPAPLKENGHDQINNNAVVVTSNQNLEDGEVAEEVVDPNLNSSRHLSRSRHSHSGGDGDGREEISRRRTRSRSPSSWNKRSRGSSDDQRRSLRNQVQPLLPVDRERGRHDSRSASRSSGSSSHEPSRRRGYQGQHHHRFSRRWSLPIVSYFIVAPFLLLICLLYQLILRYALQLIAWCIGNCCVAPGFVSPQSGVSRRRAQVNVQQDEDVLYLECIWTSPTDRKHTHRQNRHRKAKKKKEEE